MKAVSLIAAIWLVALIALAVAYIWICRHQVLPEGALPSGVRRFILVLRAVMGASAGVGLAGEVLEHLFSWPVPGADSAQINVTLAPFLVIGVAGLVAMEYFRRFGGASQ
ncbi:MAG: hypothetical protein M3Z66_21850 [Chloroflexota bacterium]|nr:hypothetical protein [Chloroflexota bacterium]